MQLSEDYCPGKTLLVAYNTIFLKLDKKTYRHIAKMIDKLSYFVAIRLNIN